MSLSVIVASGGRPTLSRTVQSIIPQLDVLDELIVVVDQTATWGHSTRNRAMRFAKGDHLCFMDDDDEYTPDAFEHMRAAIDRDPDAMWIFRMRYADGRELWAEQELRLGNVSTQLVLVPNKPPLGRWADGVYEGDWHFIEQTAKDKQVRFDDHVIALIRPAP